MDFVGDIYNKFALFIKIISAKVYEIKTVRERLIIFYFSVQNIANGQNNPHYRVVHSSGN